MEHYYVNKNAQVTGEHEVHKDGCHHCADAANRQYLGYFSDCHEAVKKAKDFYFDVDGCHYCSLPCDKK